MHAARVARDKAFAELQAKFKVEWDNIVQGHRVIVHLPSLTLTPEQRATIPRSVFYYLCTLADARCSPCLLAPSNSLHPCMYLGRIRKNIVISIVCIHGSINSLQILLPLVVCCDAA